MPSKPGLAMRLAPVFIRICAAAPKMVQQNTSPTGWRRAGFSEIGVESVMAGGHFPQKIQHSLKQVSVATKQAATVADVKSSPSPPPATTDQPRGFIAEWTVTI